MSRTLHALRMAALLALAVAVLGPAVSAEDEAPATESKVSFQDLDPKLRKDVAIAAHAYFDPTVEFLWRPRKDLKTAFDAVKASTGSDVLANIPLLREIVYQGRHFLSRYDDKKWQREEEISEHKKDGIYLNVKSERWRFTYTLPSSYPKERALEKIPRAGTEPLPLLLSIHEARDVKDARKRAEKYPGGAVLKRRYPKGDFGALYDNWLVIAPVAARAKFLEDDGAIRHRFLTQVLTEFWRHYHVDYDRIVVDGGAPAAALAAAFPHVFAGLVLRPSKGMKIEPDVVQNYGGVPVFVVGDKDLAKQLEDAGHTDVTVGSDKDVIVWMNQRERHMPRNFTWSMLRPDHRYANWIDIAVPDYTAPERTLEVETVDTEEEPNTIKIRARGIEKILLFLNDQIVDLDRDVLLVVNGHETTYDAIERDFDRVFEKDPNVRRNMNFGWLYTVLLADIAIAEPAPEPADGHDVRLAAEREWLEGRPDRLERHLGPALETTTGEQALPFALRDLWWRRTGDDALRAHVGRLPSSGLVADQIRWILGGGVGPYPTATEGDPWPILTALVRERQQRETTGTRWLPDESPVLRRRLPALPAEWQDWYGRWCTWFYEDWMRPAYEGVDPASLDPDYRDELAAQDRRAQDARRRNLWLSLLAGLLFVGGACFASRRLSQAR